jgi:hypothetical protein
VLFEFVRIIWMVDVKESGVP